MIMWPIVNQLLNIIAAAFLIVVLVGIIMAGIKLFFSMILWIIR